MPKRPRISKSKLLDMFAQAARAKVEATAPAMEVIEHLRQALLAISPFTLKDGTRVRIEPYESPKFDADNNACCGIDAKLEGMGHLEFTLKNSGWGKAFVPGLFQDRQGIQKTK